MEGEIERRRWILTGIVQGVGFRPHVARVASHYSGELTGFCGNDTLSVFIEGQGPRIVLDAFIKEVVETAPPLSSILTCQDSLVDVVDTESGFRIVASEGGSGARTLIPPDVSICPDCLADIRDPCNRRFGYAFTTCTNCGPRMSIIEDLPYDRPNTTMREFPLCEVCSREYRDPDDRRFHAQPISCFDCGPHIWMVETEEIPDGVGDPFSSAALPVDLVDGSRGGRSRENQDAVLDAVAARILSGEVVAVKGIGGFHLLVDATNESAVARLRKRKHRDGKPLALMVKDLDAARELVELGEEGSPAESLLISPAHPIVLAERRSGRPIAPSVAPGLNTLGIMLAYTPLHLLLLERIGRPVVATSGNLSSEPLCFDNAEALARLGKIADAFLLHNRTIAVPVEDSVVMAAKTAFSRVRKKLASESDTPQVEDMTGGLTLLPARRSRGYVPVPVALPARVNPDSSARADGDNLVILGVGGELKNTFTLVRGGMAFTSAHIGDMGSLASQQAYEKAIKQLTKIHDENPSVVVRDSHPNYATTAWAERYVGAAREEGREVQQIALQHHRAHAYSLLAETGVERAIVIAVDGTGYGDDGKIWGSEVFLVEAEPAAPRRLGQTLPATFPSVITPEKFDPQASLDRSAASEDGSTLLHSLGSLRKDETVSAGVAGQIQTAPRLAHLPYFPLPGGDLAVKEPWRQAAALLTTFGIETTGLPLQDRLNTTVGKAVLSQIPQSPETCALGRYFDAAAAILEICPISTYEAAAPVALQTAAEHWLAENPAESVAMLRAPAYMAVTPEISALSAVETRVLPVQNIVSELTQGMKQGKNPGELAFRFHVQIANLLASAAIKAVNKYECAAVGITGGSALNSLLTSIIGRQIEESGLTWLTHQRVPANDGGLSLGQAYYGYLLSQ